MRLVYGWVFRISGVRRLRIGSGRLVEAEIDLPGVESRGLAANSNGLS
jgi:hypothetical protein